MGLSISPPKRSIEIDSVVFVDHLGSLFYFGCLWGLSLGAVRLVHAGQGRRDDQGYDRHQFDEDIHGWSGSVFERIAYGVAGYGSFMRLRFLEEHLAVDLYTLLK